MLPTFIRLENTLEEAMHVNASPYDIYTSYNGVHLPTSSPYLFIQRTYANDGNGIEIEDYEIEFFDLCGNNLNAATTSETFTVVRNFNDETTGLPQIEWALNTDGLDFGNTLVYFRITSGVNGYVYSSPFTITDEQAKDTSYWFYKNKDTMLSIGLNLYFRNRKSDQTLSNYDPVSTGNTITGTARITPFERWITGIINSDILEEFKKISLCRYIYSLPYTFSGLPVKTGFYKAVDSVDPNGNENFVQQEILLIRNYNYTFNPNAIPVTPVPPPVDPPYINLDSVAKISDTQVRYTFNYGNFATDYLIYEYSLDGINWVSTAKSDDSPQLLDIPDGIDVYDLVFRISSGRVTSNEKTIPKRALILNSVIRPSIGDDSKYRIDYTIDNYTPLGKLSFLYSPDNKAYRQAQYFDGNENPKDVIVPLSITTAPYFKIKDETNGILSNTIQYTE